MGQRIRILMAEKDLDFINMIENALRVTGDCYEIETVDSGGECLAKLQKEKFDILLLDHALSDGDGLEWLKKFNRLEIGIPTIFVTAKGDIAMSLQAMQEGVFDYINRSAECAKAFPFVVNRVVAGYNLMVEKVRLQRELIEARNFLESIIEKAGDAISVTDGEGNIIYWNEGAEKIYGWRKEEVMGKKIGDLLLVDDKADRAEQERQFYEVEAKVLRGEVVTNVEGKRKTKEGLEIITSMTASPLRDATGKIVGVSRICKDMTQLKKAEEKLLLAERLSSMGELIAGVAHEIRNPLAGIKINTQILARKKDLPELEKQIIGSTLEGIGKIQKIVEDMLDYARPRAAQYKKEEINPLVAKCLDVLRAQFKKANIVAHFEQGTDLPLVKIDSHQIQQVLMNLMLNAVQAMDKGGTLSVRTYLTRKGEVAIDVQDTGSGIPAAHLKRIFDPFFTTKSRGTGLGLSISLKLLENHGATLEVATEEEKGSTFTIRFPAEEKK